MTSNGIPTRTEANYLSEMIVLSANPQFDLFLFVEDETSPWAYKQIVKRVFHNNVTVGKVFALKAKSSVIRIFKDWSVSKQQKAKCIFIIDRDFDYWAEESISCEENVLEIPCYTLENLFLDEASVNHLLEINAREKDIEDLIEPDFSKQWIINIFEGLEPLFIDFALVKKNKFSKESTSRNPNRYITEEGEVRESEINKYHQEVIELFEQNGIDYQMSRELMINFFVKEGIKDYNSLIKGKYLMHALVKKVNFITNSKIKTPIDSNIMSLLIYSVDKEKFQCIKEKYVSIKA